MRKTAVLLLGLLCTAMFAQPAVTWIEKVVGLVHKLVGTGCKARAVYQVPGVGETDTRHLVPETHSSIGVAHSVSYRVLQSNEPAATFAGHCVQSRR